MTPYEGPSFQLIETITSGEFNRRGGFITGKKPFLVKGAIKSWPAWEKWSFDWFADLMRDVDKEVVATFQNGLIEQGATKKPLDLPVAPYMRTLAEAPPSPQASRDAEAGLCSDRVFRTLRPGDSFKLNWRYLKSVTPNKVYLGQWDIMEAFPQLKRDIMLLDLWKWRTNWPHIWIGPAHTVTGLHTDYPDNWFCEFRGEKEFILFPPENDPFLLPSAKYDYGAVLSRINVMRLDEQTSESAIFSKARGLYARVQPGDAMFVPKNTWHCVMAMEPSISLSVFGLTPWELIAEGSKKVVLDLFHNWGWYRRGNCTCHEMRTDRYAM